MRAFLVPYEDASVIAEKVKAFLSKLHPNSYFVLSERILTHSEIGKLCYTELGNENEELFPDSVSSIIHEIKTRGYKTPIVVVEKGRRRILIDGHKRALSAFVLGMPWNAYVIKTNAKKLAIEKSIIGTLESIFRQSLKSRFVN